MEVRAVWGESVEVPDEREVQAAMHRRAAAAAADGGTVIGRVDDKDTRPSRAFTLHCDTSPIPTETVLALVQVFQTKKAVRGVHTFIESSYTF